MLGIALIIALLFLAGCSSSTGPTAGTGDDFPNTMTSAANSLLSSLEQAGGWKQIDVLGDTIASVSSAESLLVAPLAPADSAAGGLSRRAAVHATSADSIVWDFADTALGIVRKYRYANDFFVVTTEVYVLAYNISALDTIPENDTILDLRGESRVVFSDEWYTYYFADTDTNGFLDTGAVSHVVRGLFNVTTTWASGWNMSGITPE